MDHCLDLIFDSPISGYPRNDNGRVQVRSRKRKKGDMFYAEGVRGYLFYRYAKPAVCTELTIDGKVWMTDEWTYAESLKYFAKECFGDVLVAGLGLGIVIHYLSQNKNVKSITVIERDRDVIDLIKPLVPECTIMNDDFNNGSSEWNKKHYDCVVWDLAVRAENDTTEGKEILYIRHVINARFGSPKVFIHGIDRDPIGEEFVKTETFRLAQLYMTENGFLHL